ncbi:MAG: 2-hydroxyacyl-CoA dehydratase [Deltaproteobacteria bacterium]|nr:2-hydroxyacyl-CoA dehydratase [Deltaproteobacteria bacterium]
MDHFSEFRAAYENRHGIAKDWKQDGKKVFGYIYSGVPEELMYAAGVLPVQLMESDEDTVQKGETILPIFVCDYCQSALGQALTGEYDYLDGLVVTDACANARTLVRAWEVHGKTPYLYYFNPPFFKTPEGRRYYARELVRFRESIEAFCDVQITNEAIGSAIETYNENRRLIRELYELRSRNGVSLSGSRILEVLRAGLVLPKEAHNRMLGKLLRELPHEEKRQEGGIPVFLSMLIFEHCMTADFNLMEMIEELGGLVAMDDVWMGPRYYSEPVEPGPDPMKALVERYLGNVPSGYRYPLKPRLDWICDQLDRYKIKGAVFVVPKYCHPYLFEYPYIDRELKKRGIATLFLETEGSMPRETVRVRLQAFMELLG